MSTEAVGPTVLLVDDDPAIRKVVAAGLELEGFTVVPASGGRAALEAVPRVSPAVILLDLGMPDLDGLEVLRQLRAAGDQTPVCVLSARDEIEDRVGGLEAGADDYVVKPFSARELVARVRAVLRRFEATARQADQPAGGGAVEVGGVRLDTARRQVTLDGEPVELSRKEYELLALLMRHAGAVVTREQAIEEVWDTNWFGSTKTLDVHISGLRKKLGDDPAAPAYIHTARGVGFRFAGPDEFSAGAGTP